MCACGTIAPTPVVFIVISKVENEVFYTFYGIHVVHVLCDYML